MFDFTSTTFSPKERVEILFKEYDTLRTEIITRTTGGYNFLTVCAVVFVALLAWLSSHGATRPFWSASIIFVVTIVLFCLAIRRDINIIARRIAEIEREVNKLADGPAILRWETERGAAATNWVFRRDPSVH